MKKTIVLIGVCAAILLCAGFGILIFVSGWVRMPDLPQPKFGFSGDWRRQNQFGFKEAPLPPAAEVWKRFESWSLPTNDLSAKYYIARLGHPENQMNFRSWSEMTHEMPLGDYYYTYVEFDYNDPTNGVYHLSWSLRGKHDTSFLKLDGTERLYQLEAQNCPGEIPPRLRIVAIEGIEPWGN